ncbi:hypothetical protein OIY81_3216 [Cryptosporidium canis]|uniref:Uncharacterized protein n=1 Tax=Cryptosporidium canis TaxID=195482 RepID=A0ABQ8PB06_9CRYT|nr:hypothetical protein OIY81_3216 [Cryptosporidium canis]KAJ1614861.1 hypothetical protein OJ252_476 [Cryptosporidium canis]
MEEEISIRSAEERAIKEAEYIAASESKKLIQELSLRLETSEPNSKSSSRSPSVAAIEESAAKETEPEDQPIQEGGVEEEKEEVSRDNNEKSPSQDEITSVVSGTNEPIIEIREGEDMSQIIKQESKLILGEFGNDSISFKEEQQETNGHSEDSEIIVLEDPEAPAIEENEDSSDEITPVDNQEPIEVEGCGHKLRGFTDSTKSGISGIIQFQKSIFNDCRHNAASLNTQLKKTSWDYFDSLHSRLIKLAGFHNPDECSICKDFKHQDVPLLN